MDWLMVNNPLANKPLANISTYIIIHTVDWLMLIYRLSSQSTVSGSPLRVRPRIKDVVARLQSSELAEVRTATGFKTPRLWKNKLNKWF